MAPLSRGRLVVMTMYDFTDPEAIINNFKATPDGKGTQCHYESRMFTIQHDKTVRTDVTKAFLRILDDYIRTDEQRAGHDQLDLPRVSRVIGSYAFQGDDLYQEVYSKYGRETSPTATAAEHHTQKSSDDPEPITETLFDHENSVRRWETSLPMELAQSFFDTDLLKHIDDLTNCRIELHGAQITVAGDSNADVDQAMEKLYRVGTSKLKRRIQSSFDFPFVEKETSFRLLFRSPEWAMDRSLWDDNETQLSDLVRLILARWDASTENFKPAPQSCVMIPRCEDRSSILWAGLGWSTHGENGNDPKNWTDVYPEGLAGNVQPAKAEVVAAWNEGVTTDLIDPFTNQVPPVEHDAIPNERDPSHRKTQRIAKAQALHSPNEGSPAKSQSIIDDTWMGFPPGSLIMPTIRLPAGITTERREPESGGGRPAPHYSGAVGPLIDFSTDDQDHPSSKIPNPSNPMLAIPPQTPTKLSSQQESALSENTVMETVQAEAERETRQLRSTPQLMKSSIADDIPSLGVDSRIFQAAGYILEMARASSNSDISMELTFGSMYENNRYLDSRHLEHGFSLGSWSEIFQTEPQDYTRPTTSYLETRFSPKLSNSWVDAEFLLNIRLPSDVRMFVQEPVGRTILYQLIFEDRRTKLQVFLEVDHQGNHFIRSKPHAIGAINLHFPRRRWDARLSVTEKCNVSSKSQDPIGKILNSLWIGKASETDITPTIYVRQDASPDVDIIAVFARRETTHQATKHDLLLHLTEVQQFVLDRRYHNGAAYVTGSDKSIFADDRIHWEARVTSSAADTLFQENRTLAVGDMAKWEGKTIIDSGILEELVDMATKVVPRINNVGASSHNFAEQRKPLYKPVTTTMPLWGKWAGSQETSQESTW